MFSMTFVAQTNLQLYKQLSELDFSQKDLEYMHQVYYLALQLYPFLFRPNGKEHLAHAVGTASILCSLQKRVPVIAAGLLHAAYRHGEFPSFRKGPTKSNRKYIQNVVGQETEEHIARYFYLQWDRQNFIEMQERFTELSEIDRDSLLIRLADNLEKCVDLGVLFVSSGPGGKRSIRTNGPTRVALARKLGYPALADQLQAAHEAILNADIPSVLCNSNRAKADFLLVPLSSRLRLFAWFSSRFFPSTASSIRKIFQ
jgi:(p)ppGpp synthase/HD superfamily hydrolase